MMPRRRSINIQFPLGGLDRHGAHRQQPPYTTQDCLNVRSTATIQGRERGGSRPGLIESHADSLGAEVRLLAPMTLALGDGFTAWSDTFSGLSMAEAWTQASWAEALPAILPTALASIDTSVADAAAVLDALSIDTSEAYTVEVFLAPWGGAWHGVYKLYCRLDDATPDAETDGIVVELTMTGTSGDYSATLTSLASGTPTELDTDSGTLSAAIPGWLTVTVSSTAIKVYWGNAEIMSGTADAHSGVRTGFGLECTVEGGLCLANVFRVQYFATVSISGSRSALIASAGGDLYKEETYGQMVVITSDLTVRDDVLLTAAQSGQVLYIADYGDLRDTGTDGTVTGSNLDDGGAQDWTTLGIDTDSDVCVISNVGGATVAGTYKISSVQSTEITLASAPGNGTCSYRIERAPKVYTPADDTFEIMTASTGQVPTGCPLICRYLDRIVLAGAEIAPHVWYMSRVADPLDWDYAQTDNQRAAAGGTLGDAGVPGDDITALIPHSDDYLILGGRNSVWRLRGDPAYGGSMDALSYKIGIIGANAWCLGPAGELVFLSLNGLYALPPGGGTYPIPLSEGPLPREFLNLNPDMLTVSLEYDVQDNGIHIYLTPESSNTRIHWWMDWETKTYWPVSLDSDHEPTATCFLQAVAIEDSGVILGGRDGTLRRLSHLAEMDCGTAFATYVVCGPIPLAPDSQVGVVSQIDAVMADGSGDVTWNLYPALTFEGTVSANSSDTGTWSEGLSASDRPACRGQACTLKITGSSGRRWAVENITAIISSAGKRRV